MSYSRWSNSSWYSFYNCNGCFSLWHVNGISRDISYYRCKTINEEIIIDIYKCTLKEAKEEMIYVENFIEDFEEDEKKSLRGN